MTAPGMVPHPDRSVVDRVGRLEFRLRSMQQATAGTPTATLLGNTVAAPVAAPASAGGATTAARSDHVHTATLAALQDASVSAPGAGDRLGFSGTAWANVPTVVATLAAITAPYPGQLVYNSTDALLYKFTSGAWVAVAALGPDSPGAPAAAQLHEARYRAVTGSAQALTTGNTAIQFGVTDYTCADVTASGTGNSIFTLNRGGVWTADINARITDTTSGVTRQIQLTNSTFATIFHALTQPVVGGSGPLELAMTCTMRFAAGTALSVVGISSSTGSIDRSTATTASETSLALTWLRP